MNILDAFGYVNPEKLNNDVDKKALIDFHKYIKITLPIMGYMVQKPRKTS